MPSFPQVVGRTGEKAREIILGIDPSLNVFILAEGSMVTKDLRTNRVRIFVNANGIVENAPRTG